MITITHVIDEDKIYIHDDKNNNEICLTYEELKAIQLSCKLNIKRNVQTK